ncbi:hypothetical protein AVEN_83626-1 [Araneus ventricosus]|uniref:Uncharacterized protein n=1 Tax=Araneus ventricosus TaxID=182803 RepID=A0A4Y2CER2_ARAVE|nr:hypothetical protein AVEN_244164-1 [Araneus ventricosus]GBM02215.1 hypothetical protein AVEN_267963-1 [Araneus ventricosus]GBM02232.1 hypothetical protein AVEN_60353-1 [Araneus ventricosus]GBM02247.1 hypothetical protein AVEN_83626-1 [Araneus ventricosus]
MSSAVRDSLAAQYFVDAIRDEDTQHATRFMDAKDMKTALAYSMKYEAAKTVSKASRNVRSKEIEDGTGKEKDKKILLFTENFGIVIKHSCCWEEDSTKKSERDLLEM